MTREIGQFKGRNAIIGCTASHPSCEGECHPQSQYYSFDFYAKGADFPLDITASLPVEFKKRFNITLVENLDFQAYNTDAFHRYDGKSGFTNIWEMTEDEGYILIIGCPREVEYRISIKDLKYIELDSQHSYVLIPKNQNINIEEIRERIRAHPQLNSLIVKLVPDATAAISNFSFCDVSIEYFSRISQSTLSRIWFENKTNPIVSELFAALNRLVIGNQSSPELRAIYRNLFQLTNNFFNQSMDILYAKIPQFQELLSFEIVTLKTKLSEKGAPFIEDFLVAVNNLSHLNAVPPQTPQEDVLVITRQFNALIKPLEDKIERRLEKFPAAQNEAKLLIQSLRTATEKYYTSPKTTADFTAFQEACSQSFSPQKVTHLCGHRRIMGALFAFINNFFKTAFKKTFSNEDTSQIRFFDKRSDSAKILDTLKEDIKKPFL